MPILLLFVFCATVYATVPDTGTILLSDTTQVTTVIVDTTGGIVVVRRNGRDVQIDKNLIRRLILGTDTVHYVPDKRRDANRKSGCAGKTPLSITAALKESISRYPVKKKLLIGGSGITFQKQAVSGTFDSAGKTAAAFSNTMVAFLKKHGPVRTISKESAYFFLSGDEGFNNNSRYLALPAEIAVHSSERKANISSFVKLDSRGNFIPTKTAMTYRALETETSVRFVVMDLTNRTIVFDERITEVDKGLRQLDSKKPEDTQNNPVNNSILIIERKIELLLQKQIK